MRSFQKLTLQENLLNNTRSIFLGNLKLRDVDDRREMLRSVPIKDEGAAGEKAMEMDILISQCVLTLLIIYFNYYFKTNNYCRKQNVFPDKDTPSRVFNGIMFKELPILNIRVSPNNTVINLTNCNGKPELIRSCGIEGFKNTRKGTNIAAQATAISMGTVSKL